MKNILNTFCLIIILASCQQRNVTREKENHPPIDSSLQSDTTVKIIAKKKEIYLEPLSEDALSKISVDLSEGDSRLNLYANIRNDYRIFGYAQPDTDSEKLLLFSVFTDEVDGNPFDCKYGSYYSLGNSDQNFHLTYKKSDKNFVVVNLNDSLGNNRNVYFEKKWIDLN